MFNARERAFFAAFPDFTPNQSAPPKAEFARLASLRTWKTGGKLWRRHWRSCFGSEFRPDDTLDDSSPPSFFDAFAGAGFTSDPAASLAAEFARLALHKGWSETSKAYRDNRLLAYEAEFERHYGADASRLENWQALCVEVGVAPVPSSITKCKKALRNVHVNLVDLVDRRRTGGALHIFKSLAALRKYTTGNKVFPKAAAKKDGFLKALLREIF